MLISNFLNSRKSIRDYKNKKITDKDAEAIKEILDKENKDAESYEFTLYRDGKKVFEGLDGHGGYGGVMIEAPAYLALNIFEEDPKAYVEGAYKMEEIETELAEIGLGSCWVTLLEASEEVVKDALEYDTGRIKYLLALGYPARTFNFGSSEFVPKMGVEEFVFKNKEKETYTMDELENMGLADVFYYLRMAPSSKDKQPTRFIVDNHDIYLYAKNLKNTDDYMDIGIVLYYFDQLAKASNFDAKWTIDIKDDENDLTYIGKTSY